MILQGVKFKEFIEGTQTPFLLDINLGLCNFTEADGINISYANMFGYNFEYILNNITVKDTKFLDMNIQNSIIETQNLSSASNNKNKLTFKTKDYIYLLHDWVGMYELYSKKICLGPFNEIPITEFPYFVYFDNVQEKSWLLFYWEELHELSIEEQDVTSVFISHKQISYEILYNIKDEREAKII